MKKVLFISIVIISLALVITNMFIIVNTDHIKRSKALQEYTISDKGNLKKSLPTKGVVIPSDHYSLSYNESLGMIKEITVEEGDTILEGDTLIEYDTSHIENEILALEQKVERISRQLSKSEEDIAELEQELIEPTDEEEEDLAQQEYNNISSQIAEKEYQIEEFEIQIDETNQKIEQLQLDLENYTIISKMDGIVTKVNPFAQNQSDLVVSIDSNQPYLIEGKLSEEEVVRAKEGQKVLAAATVLPNQKNEGTIKEIKMTPIEKPSVDDKQSFYPFEVEMNEAVENWHHGFHINVEIVLEERSGVVIVPDSAIQKKASKSYVYVVKNGRLEKRNLKLGMKVNHRQEVVQGLEKGERIVSKSTKDLENKMEIFMPINHLYLKKETMNAFTKDQTIRLVVKGLFQ